MSAMVERLDPERLAIAEGTEADLRRFIESDYRIRTGVCPNGCGLMAPCEYGQECPACGFSCNKPAEEGPAQ
jgi:hypothetical protein